MSEARTLFLVSDAVRARAVDAVRQAPVGYRVTISPPAKTRGQEERYHAMLNDIAEQTLFDGEKLEADDWKRILLDALARIRKQLGRPLSQQQGRIVRSLDGTGFVELGTLQSRRLLREEATDFIEMLFHFGAERGVQWSDPTLYPPGQAPPRAARRRAREPA